MLRNLTNMSWEAYAGFARFGFLVVILLLNLSPFRTALGLVTDGTLLKLGRAFGMTV